MLYIISPRSGWEEIFYNQDAALKRATLIVENDEEGLVSLHGYRNPDELVQERYSSMEEMYKDLEEYEQKS